ncbi:MAG TPA: hypothetical protein VLF66_11185 [Thermoanaerobaculia bacterium]|nr:hypothetical protein [Thermoanaerobaculia bacterium]
MRRPSGGGLGTRLAPVVLAMLAAAAALVPAPTAAQEAPAPAAMEPPPGFGTNQANFCRGTYALCITAQCAAIPTLDRLGNYYVNHALCECDVIEDSEESPAWSMGPGSCEDHGPVTQNGRTFLISTYSNLYNDSNQVVQCGADTLWAWCYGAPCVVDEEDPTKAICNCPLLQEPANLLVSDCSQTDYCGQIWSAAVPPGDCFANCRYYQWAQENDVQSGPVAELCTGGPVCSCPSPPTPGGGAAN